MNASLFSDSHFSETVTPSPGENRVIQIVLELLKKSLSNPHIEIQDESEKHSGHSTNPLQGRHFIALIVSNSFEGLSLLERHRLIYQAIGSLIGKEIHAFSMKTLTEKEHQDLTKSHNSRQS